MECRVLVLKYGLANSYQKYTKYTKVSTICIGVFYSSYVNKYSGFWYFEGIFKIIWYFWFSLGTFSYFFIIFLHRFYIFIVPWQWQILTSGILKVPYLLSNFVSLVYIANKNSKVKYDNFHKFPNHCISSHLPDYTNLYIHQNKTHT